MTLRLDLHLRKGAQCEMRFPFETFNVGAEEVEHCRGRVYRDNGAGDETSCGLW